MKTIYLNNYSKNIFQYQGHTNFKYTHFRNTHCFNIITSKESEGTSYTDILAFDYILWVWDCKWEEKWDFTFRTEQQAPGQHKLQTP